MLVGSSSSSTSYLLSRIATSAARAVCPPESEPERPVRRDVEADLGGDLGQPVLEVGRAEVQPVLERVGVRVVGVGLLLGQRLGRGVQRAVGLGDAGTPPGVGEQRLVGVGRDLRQPADRRVGGREADRARLDRQLTDQGAHERGLAGAVRADQGGHVAIGDDEVEAGDEGARAVRDAESGEGESGGQRELQG